MDLRPSTTVSASRVHAAREYLRATYTLQLNMAQPIWSRNSTGWPSLSHLPLPIPACPRQQLPSLGMKSSDLRSHLVRMEHRLPTLQR